MAALHRCTPARRYGRPVGMGYRACGGALQGGVYRVEGSMDASATPDAAFSLLTDYERVAAVFSNVLRSQTFRCVGAETRLQQARQFIFFYS